MLSGVLSALLISVSGIGWMMKGVNGTVVLALIAGLILLYHCVGVCRSIRIFWSKTGISKLTRPVLKPFGRPVEVVIPFAEIESFLIEAGPRSHLGPQVVGENVVVIQMTSGEVRLSSRWLSDSAFKQLVRDLKDAVPRTEEASG